MPCWKGSGGFLRRRCSVPRRDRTRGCGPPSRAVRGGVWARSLLPLAGEPGADVLEAGRAGDDTLRLFPCEPPEQGPVRLLCCTLPHDEDEGYSRNPG